MEQTHQKLKRLEEKVKKVEEILESIEDGLFTLADRLEIMADAIAFPENPKCGLRAGMTARKIATNIRRTREELRDED